jgi:hypothetical protein
MRVAWILLALVACSKQAEKPRAEEPAAAAPVTLAAPTAPAEPTTAAPPPAGGSVGAAPADDSVAQGAERAKTNAKEEARASGVLGPTDRAAFDVRGKVTFKTATKALDEAVQPKLAALQACYDKALTFQDTLAGELTLKLAAGKLAVARSTVKHAELETCVLEALADITLPKARKATITLAFARE